MESILIQNFGPIVNSSKVDVKINKVTVFCGKQGAGKSSIAKLISQFYWLEKALIRGDFTIPELEEKNAFQEKYCSFHNISNYFTKATYLHFKGKRFSFEYQKGILSVSEKKSKNTYYVRPQVMYIPSERNLMTAIDNAYKLQDLPPSLSVLIGEYYRALKSAAKPIKLPLDNYKVIYDDSTKLAWLSDSKFKIKMTEAASGFQSMVPLIIVSRFLFNRIKSNRNGEGRTSISEAERTELNERITKLLKDSSLSDQVRKDLIEHLGLSTLNSRLINIVEEPEQNLYPDTQREIINELLKINNELTANQLVITTHSPYVLNYLTLAIKAGALKDNIRKSSKKETLLEMLGSVVPRSSTLKSRDVSIYELSADGEISPLNFIDDIPSDYNVLNTALSTTNDLFDKLLEIEDEVG